MRLVDFLLDRQMIRLNVAVANWQEAVRSGIELLADAGIVQWRYYDAILDSVARNGAYFVLMPGVALPHARPEMGALADGFSLITLAEPVNFGSPENDPISVLLSFAAKDAQSQVETSLAQAVVVFEEEERVERIREAKTIDEIEMLLRSIDFSEVE